MHWNRFIEHSLTLIWFTSTFDRTKKRLHARGMWKSLLFSLIVWGPRNNRFLKICHQDTQKILWVSRYSTPEPPTSILYNFEDRVSSWDCQLTFARYCRFMWQTSCILLQFFLSMVNKWSIHFSVSDSIVNYIHHTQHIISHFFHSKNVVITSDML